MHALSMVERDVLAGVAAGETAEETAARTHRATATVKHHRRHLLSKLRARNAAHAVALAFEYGLLGRPVVTISDPQLVAFQTMTGILARRRGVSRDQVRRQYTQLVAEHFGRDIDDYKDLTAVEASWILDELKDEVDG